MYQPLISVTVPVHNTAKHLNKCLESIVSQTYQNIEVICVDDGSSDNSLEILQKYAATDPRVRIYIHDTPQGVSAARNTAHRNSRGEFITSVDSDDYLHPQAYERAVALITDEVDWVCYAAQLVDEDGNKLIDQDGYYSIHYEGTMPMAPEMVEHMNVCIWSKLWRKSVMDEHRMEYPVGYVHEDNAMLYQFAPFVRKVAFTKEVGYYYVHREGSIMNSNRSALDDAQQNIGILRHVHAFYCRENLHPTENPYFLHQFSHIYYLDERMSHPEERKELAAQFCKLAEEFGLFPRYAQDPRFSCMRLPVGLAERFIRRRSFCTQYRLGVIPLVARMYMNGRTTGWRFDAWLATRGMLGRLRRKACQLRHAVYEWGHMKIYGYDCWHAEMKRLICNQVYTNQGNCKPDSSRLIVYMTEGTEYAGLADRLRTFISAAIIATENNRRLCIYHDKGFALEQYLEPNEADWRIKPEEICRDASQVECLWFSRTLPKQLHPQKECHAYALDNILLELPRQMQGKYTYAEVFHKLFRPTAYLSSMVTQAMQACGIADKAYVAVHLRFLNFFEPVEEHMTQATGTPEQQKQVLIRVHAALERIHQESGGLPIVLFADSNRFLQANHPEYVKILPGTVGHIIRHNAAADIADKAFTDLFVMSKAKSIYRITGKHIYNGGFAKAAAGIGGKELIERPYPRG